MMQEHLKRRRLLRIKNLVRQYLLQKKTINRGLVHCTFSGYDEDLFTLTLQKSRMPQILGVEGEAVVLYREPSTTQEMWHSRLSRRVNKMAVFSCFHDTTCSGFHQSIRNEDIACICSFLTYFAILFMQLRG